MTSKQELDSTLARLGLSLRPMHPGAADDELARYFTLTDPSGPGLSREDAEQVLETLRGLNAVTAAYAKPGAEPA